MRFLSILCVLLATWSSPAWATTPRILVMGDSLSAAYGMPLQQGWVALLQNRLTHRGYKYTVINGSVSGETTAGGRSRLGKLLNEHKPALVVIELGGNDGLRALPLKNMQANLIAMIDQSKAAGAQVLLLEMRIPLNYGARYANQFQRTFSDVAKLKSVTLVPFFLADIATDPKFFLADGIHPSAEAQPLLLKALWPAIEAKLKK